MLYVYRKLISDCCFIQFLAAHEYDPKGVLLLVDVFIKNSLNKAVSSLLITHLNFRSYENTI